MKSKLLSIVLAAVLVLALCVPALAEGGLSEPGVYPIWTGDEPYVLKVLVCTNAHVSDWDDNTFTKWVEEKCNVDLQFEFLPEVEPKQKLTIMLDTNEELPDVVLYGLSVAEAYNYGSKGKFVNLREYLDDGLGVNIDSAVERFPTWNLITNITNSDGSVYAVPKIQASPQNETKYKLWINKTYLDNLGLEMPTDTDEFREMLEAFRDNDANGNGNPGDEVPMDFNGWFGSAYSLSNMIGSWGIQLVNWGYDGYFAEGGVIKNFAVDERYKGMMTYLADLYAEGLINPNAITNDYSMFQSLSRGDADGNALVGVVLGWEETDKFGPNIYNQYIPCGPFVDDVDELATSEPRWTYDFSGLNMSSNRVAMSAKCANPEAAMKFIDKFYEPQHSVESLFGGVLDGNLEIVGDDHYKVLDPPEEAHTDNGTWKWTSTFADNGPMYIRRATQIDMAKDMAFALAERDQYKEAIARIDMENEYYPQFLMKYSVDDQNTLAQLQVGITSVTDSWWGMWMTGEADINDTWEDYVAEVNANGLEQVLAIRQAAYDAWKAQ